MKIYDLLIIGAGPGGLTAALYAARYRMEVLVIGKLLGGTVSTAHRVCNYPGFEEIKGPELIFKMINHVKNLNVEIKQEEVTDIKQGGSFKVKTKKGEYYGRKIIIATGSEKVKLGLEREEELVGKGISYCATCDAPFYKNKTVGVVGGGNSALTSALLLSEFAKKVYIFYRRDLFFKAESFWIDEIERNKKIEVFFNSSILELAGNETLKGVLVLKDKEKLKFDLDGLFIEVGIAPNLKLAKLLGLEIDQGFVKVDKEQKTNLHGVLAVGDVTNNPLKQIVTACGEGAIAGLTVYKEILQEKSLKAR